VYLATSWTDLTIQFATWHRGFISLLQFLLRFCYSHNQYFALLINILKLASFRLLEFLVPGIAAFTVSLKAQ
jgi:hypothetical protein